MGLNLFLYENEVEENIDNENNDENVKYQVPEILLPLFDKLDKLIIENFQDKNLKSYGNKTCQSYKKENELICSITSRKGMLRIYFGPEKSFFEDQNGILEELTKAHEGGAGKCRYEFKDDTHFDDIIYFIRQIFDKKSSN